MLNRYVTPDEIRNALTNPSGLDDFDICDASDALLAHLDALEQDPTAYGFEFVEDDDEHMGRAGSREYYYVWRLPTERLPEGFTSAVYIIGHGDEAREEESILRLRGLLVTSEGDETDSDYETEDYYETTAQAVAWLNEQLGAEIIKPLGGGGSAEP